MLPVDMQCRPSIGKVSGNALYIWPLTQHRARFCSWAVLASLLLSPEVSLGYLCSGCLVSRFSRSAPVLLIFWGVREQEGEAKTRQGLKTTKMGHPRIAISPDFVSGRCFVVQMDEEWCIYLCGGSFDSVNVPQTKFLV